MDISWDEVLSHILDARSIRVSQHLLIGVDGVDGSGKTTFAKKLADLLSAHAVSNFVPIIPLDNFHNRRNIRYRQGRKSPIGFFQDSFNYERLKELALDPLRESCGTKFSISLGSHNLETDEEVEFPMMEVAAQSFVICEGIFLQREEIRDYFDFFIFLDVPFEESVRRMSVRDGSPSAVTHPDNKRYVQGQRIYLETYSPRENADLVIAN